MKSGDLGQSRKLVLERQRLIALRIALRHGAGMDIVYCHGLPGSPTEVRAFASTEQLRNVATVDRLAWRGASYREAVLAAFDALKLGAPLEIVGFSLGAMTALHIAAYRPAMVRKLILISPAAPLELGDFLPSMTGRAVFDAARHGSLSLRVLSAAQLALASLAPNSLLKLMFEGSTVAEQGLLHVPKFRSEVVEALKQCLGPRQAAYHAELEAYVRPWADVIDRVSCEVEIWYGDEDRWAPASMAKALRARLCVETSLRICSGLGHYTTLQAALAEVL